MPVSSAVQQGPGESHSGRGGGLLGGEPLPPAVSRSRSLFLMWAQVAGCSTQQRLTSYPRRTHVPTSPRLSSDFPCWRLSSPRGGILVAVPSAPGTPPGILICCLLRNDSPLRCLRAELPPTPLRRHAVPLLRLQPSGPYGHLQVPGLPGRCLCPHWLLAPVSCPRALAWLRSSPT